jgi:F-type H+-transporting ATPase subunit gamma
MAKARAVLKRLKAVKNIRKITRTMELIATARFKKAMDRATQASAYTNKIAELASDLASSATDFVHPLLEGRTEQKNGILLILTSNRGLCGGFNAGVMKIALQRIRDAKAAGQNLRIEVSGKRGINILKFQKIDFGQSFTGFEDKPRFDEVDQIASRYIAQYTSRSIDFVDVAYVRFVSAARQIASLDSLLPLAKPQVKEGAAEAAVDYEFLPNPREILEEILPAAFKARLFKCFLDAAVSEQIFRMVAMKGATENAGEMISSLSRQYNRARQAQITSELSEIIGGAEAIK